MLNCLRWSRSSRRPVSGHQVYCSSATIGVLGSFSPIISRFGFSSNTRHKTFRFPPVSCLRHSIHKLFACDRLNSFPRSHIFSDLILHQFWILWEFCQHCAISNIPKLSVLHPPWIPVCFPERWGDEHWWYRGGWKIKLLWTTCKRGIIAFKINDFLQNSKIQSANH